MSLKKKEGRLIGIIGKSTGLKGELYLRLITDYPNSVCKGGIFYLDPGLEKPVRLDNKRVIGKKGKQRLIVKFNDYDSPEEAEELSGRNLYRDHLESPKPKYGQFWIDQILGCSVKIKKDQKPFAELIDVLQYTGNDIMVLKTSSGEELLVPFIEDYVYEVNVKNKEIILKSIPEYI